MQTSLNNIIRTKIHIQVLMQQKTHYQKQKTDILLQTENTYKKDEYKR